MAISELLTIKIQKKKATTPSSLHMNQNKLDNGKILENGIQNFTVPQILFLNVDNYMDELRDELKSEFQNHSQGTNAKAKIEDILSSVKSFSKLAAGWGYKWRKSYKDMTPKEVIDYINGAIATARNASTDPLVPAVCLTLIVLAWMISQQGFEFMKERFH
eukprot:Gb_28347 [translate_table: standard]